MQQQQQQKQKQNSEREREREEKKDSKKKKKKKKKSIRPTAAEVRNSFPIISIIMYKLCTCVVLCLLTVLEKELQYG